MPLLPPVIIATFSFKLKNSTVKKGGTTEFQLKRHEYGKGLTLEASDHTIALEARFVKEKEADKT